MLRESKVRHFKKNLQRGKKTIRITLLIVLFLFQNFDWLIDWFLTLTLVIFQLYRGVNTFLLT